jgi:hypothetical protein
MRLREIEPRDAAGLVRMPGELVDEGHHPAAEEWIGIG